jgi:hypothetical protein
MRISSEGQKKAMSDEQKKSNELRAMSNEWREERQK